MPRLSAPFLFAGILPLLTLVGAREAGAQSSYKAAWEVEYDKGMRKLQWQYPSAQTGGYGASNSSSPGSSPKTGGNYGNSANSAYNDDPQFATLEEEKLVEQNYLNKKDREIEKFHVRKKEDFVNDWRIKDKYRNRSYALDDYLKTFVVKFSRPYGYLAMGHALHDLGKYDEARKYFEAFFKEGGRIDGKDLNKDYYYVLAYNYFRTRDFAKAKTYISSYEKLDGKTRGENYWMSLWYYYSKSHTMALSYFQQYLQQVPHDHYMRYLAATSANTAGKFAEGLALSTQLLEVLKATQSPVHDKRNQIRGMYAEALYKSGRKKEAGQYLEQMMKDLPDDYSIPVFYASLLLREDARKSAALAGQAEKVSQSSRIQSSQLSFPPQYEKQATGWGLTEQTNSPQYVLRKINAYACYQLGMKEYESKNWEAAKKAFDQFEFRYLEGAETVRLQLKAEEATLSGQTEVARYLFNKLGQMPGDAFYSMALKCIAQKNYTKALQILDKIDAGLLSKSKMQDVTYSRAVALMETGRKTDACALLKDLNTSSARVLKLKSCATLLDAINRNDPALFRSLLSQGERGDANELLTAVYRKLTVNKKEFLPLLEKLGYTKEYFLKVTWRHVLAGNGEDFTYVATRPDKDFVEGSIKDYLAGIEAVFLNVRPVLIDDKKFITLLQGWGIWDQLDPALKSDFLSVRLGFCYIDHLEYLFGLGANPNKADKNGVYPLSRRMRTRPITTSYIEPVLRTFIQHGADPKLKDFDGVSALDIQEASFLDKETRKAIKDILRNKH